MKPSIAKQINSLEDQSIEAIKVLWKDIFGTQAPPYTKAYLIPRLAYRLQELHYGPCSDKLIAQLDYFSKRLEKGKSIVAHTRICKPLIGTKLIREYKGKFHEVIVVEKGFFMMAKPINPSRLLHEKLQVAGGMAPYFLVCVNEVSIYSYDKRNTLRHLYAQIP